VGGSTRAIRRIFDGMNNPLDSFHPAVAAWFAQRFSAPTSAQALAWPAIQAGKDVLVAAPTGSGKTLAAFLAAIDQLVKEGAAGTLPDETRVIYVSPLKALSNDIHRNLDAPLGGMRAQLAALGLPDVDIRTVVRTGDTTQTERARMRRRFPHIVVTTPESLYVLLGSESGRNMLATCRTVIVDEIHAVAGNKRGAHLALTLERLQSICARLLQLRFAASRHPTNCRGSRDDPAHRGGRHPTAQRTPRVHRATAGTSGPWTFRPLHVRRAPRAAGRC
jgi:ATP-dependent Lhr-like helicase